IGPLPGWSPASTRSRCAPSIRSETRPAPPGWPSPTTTWCRRRSPSRAPPRTPPSRAASRSRSPPRPAATRPWPGWSSWWTACSAWRCDEGAAARLPRLLVLLDRVLPEHRLVPRHHLVVRPLHRLRILPGEVLVLAGIAAQIVELRSAVPEEVDVLLVAEDPH